MSNDITSLLGAVAQGDPLAQAELFPQVYDELRRLAAAHMRRERANHTLQATALVNEAYLKLAGSDAAPNDRVHFFAIAAQQMRRILVDHARARRRQKRGGTQMQITFTESAFVAANTDTEVVELDEALQKFADIDARGARAVELMFFGGLSYAEIGEVLGVAKSTVFEDIKLAKAWLARELG